jgi:hypothetical protein
MYNRRANKKEPRETLKPSLEVLVNEYSDGFKALAQHEEELVAVTQLEQVIRLLEVSDDTKCEPRHESEAVDQLRADNYGKGNSSKEELRAYLRYAVTKISTE